MSDELFVFICQECRKEFDSDSDSEARKEFSQNFPEAAVVCDECFEKLTAERRN